MAGQKMPTLSIGLPVYNGEGYLEAALTSQSFRDFELMIADPFYHVAWQSRKMHRFCGKSGGKIERQENCVDSGEDWA